MIGDAYARSSRAANAGGGNNAFAGGQHIHQASDCFVHREPAAACVHVGEQSAQALPPQPWKSAVVVVECDA